MSNDKIKELFSNEGKVSFQSQPDSPSAYQGILEAHFLVAFRYYFITIIKLGQKHKVRTGVLENELF